MSQSYDEIKAEQARSGLVQVAALLAIVLVSIFVVVISVNHNDGRRIATTFGLILDISGLVLASYPIVFPLKKKTKKGVQFLSNMPQYRSQVLAEYAERHGTKISIGVQLIFFGFLVQLLGVWL